MKFLAPQIITFMFLLTFSILYSQDSSYLKVHFLYGSKPLEKYKGIEQKWFGGILGGHVGIESTNGEIVNFLPEGKVHLFANKKNKHGTYTIHTEKNFYAILGGNPDSVKKAVVYIPITTWQKEKFINITEEYLRKTPYDYAVFGMRCGAATYEILGKINVLPKYNYIQTCLKIFYPKKLRKLLLKKAIDNNWTVIKQAGSSKRKWEID